MQQPEKVNAGAVKEAKLKVAHRIVSLVERHNIPPQLIKNFDQTKYVPTNKSTMAQKGSSSVPIAASEDKRMINATFFITLDGTFLPMQLFYGGKTKMSLPKFSFPKTFCLSVNEKYFSNSSESIKFLQEIIIPYVDKTRSNLSLPLDHLALLIFDVFRGQMTREMMDLLEENNILVSKVPPHMTHLFQPLDLTVNKSAKDFTKLKFANWFQDELNKGLECGEDLYDFEIQYRLSVIKPLHASWLVDLYCYMTTEEINNNQPMVGNVRDIGRRPIRLAKPSSS